MAIIRRTLNHNPNNYAHGNPENGFFWHAADQEGFRLFNESSPLFGKEKNNDNFPQLANISFGEGQRLIRCQPYREGVQNYLPKNGSGGIIQIQASKLIYQQDWITMLHLPRDKRLRDPVNLSQMIEIEQKYPKIKLIIAHVGRAYCLEDVGNAFEVLSQTKSMLFDFSANTNPAVFSKLIKAVGPKRILFGSDLPITRMRMRRICENGVYVNIVPKGLYGDISGDKHMRETEGSGADSITFFLYEQIKSFLDAAKNGDLSSGDIEDIFYNNGRKIIDTIQIS